MAHLMIISRVVGEYVRQAVTTGRGLDNKLFVETAYRVLFKREPDAEGVGLLTQKLESKEMNKVNVLGVLLKSEEFHVVQGLPIHPLEALHSSRVTLIQKHLPEAKIIVDLGGGSTLHPEGALLGLGYPHHPTEVTIIDLPPEERMLSSADTSDTYVTEAGIRVRYLYRSMTDLSAIADESVDMVFSGESIEHITEEDGEIVCREAYRVLKSGGYFCLDTPNAALTRIQSPKEFIHPEHKVEYRIPELREKLERWGFTIAEEKGLCQMPNSFKSGVFDSREMSLQRGIFDSAEMCYLFYLKAIKPGSTNP
ncbi:MAG: methyltransferase domain-containing protein [Ardenticatenales bacterium]|nr:methyltransferase domain-containing protein [Ardenticatenales bacterium]